MRRFTFTFQLQVTTLFCKCFYRRVICRQINLEVSLHEAVKSTVWCAMRYWKVSELECLFMYFKIYRHYYTLLIILCCMQCIICFCIPPAVIERGCHAHYVTRGSFDTEIHVWSVMSCEHGVHTLMSLVKHYVLLMASCKLAFRMIMLN